MRGAGRPGRAVRSVSAGVWLSGQAGGATKASLEMAEAAAAEGRTAEAAGKRAGGSDADSGAGNSVIGRRGAKIRNDALSPLLLHGSSSASDGLITWKTSSSMTVRINEISLDDLVPFISPYRKMN